MADHERRIKAAYPIHPEIFDRLYTDWSKRKRAIRSFSRKSVGAFMVDTANTFRQNQWRNSPPSSCLWIPNSFWSALRLLAEVCRFPVLRVDIVLSRLANREPPLIISAATLDRFTIASCFFQNACRSLNSSSVALLKLRRSLILRDRALGTP